MAPVIIDLTRMLAGPFASLMLADLGFRVIKIEEGRVGDATRRHPPLRNNVSAYFFSANRNKESVVLDLKHPEGRGVLLDLVRRADAVVENFRPGVMESLGLSYQELREVNPDIVLMSITGFGSYGPLRDNVSFDIVAQAMSGSMATTTPDEGEPIKPAIPLGDLSGGLYGVIGVLTGLLELKLSGAGCHKEVSLVDGLVAMSERLGACCLQSPAGTYPALLFPNGVFPTKDGQIVIAAYTDDSFRALCEVIGQPQWADNPALSSAESRWKNRGLIDQSLKEILKSKPTGEWTDVFARARVPASALASIEQIMSRRDLIDNGMILTLDHAVSGPLPVFGNPIMRTCAYRESDEASPRHGEHTRSVLSNFLNYPPAKIDQLMASNAASDLIQEYVV